MSIVTAPAPHRPAPPPEVSSARSLQWVSLFGVPAFLAALSWFSDGLPVLTDLAFLLLTALCVAFLYLELPRLDRTLRFGGVIVFGGTLVWFCFDYLKQWFAIDFLDPATKFGPDVVAKTAFFHLLFIASAAAGLQLPTSRLLERMILSVPQPRADTGMFIVLVAFAIGLSPYFLFTSDPLQAISQSMFNLYNSDAQNVWLVEGRTGNLNYNWGAYLMQLRTVGEVGAIFAAFHALMMPGGIGTKCACWAVWGVTLLQAYGTGARGQIVYVTLPVVLLIYIGNRSRPTPQMRRRNVSAAVLLLASLLLLLQTQIAFRNLRYEERDYSKVNATSIEGNTMFSEAMFAMKRIPDEVPFFANNSFGEGTYRPIPDTIINFVIGPIPRALWPGKPVDKLHEWMSKTYMGTDEAFVGGFTLATGLVPDWYLRYGTGGVIQGGLLFGWLAHVFEKALQRGGRGNPMAMMVCFSLLTWLFRCFRGMSFSLLYPIIIGCLMIYVLTRVLVVREFDTD